MMQPDNAAASDRAVANGSEPAAASADAEAPQQSPKAAAPSSPKAAPEPETELQVALKLAFCFVGLQASYLTWGYIQERVMTTDYKTGRFPSATFCVFSNRVLAICAAASIMTYRHGFKWLPAPFVSFAPASISNSLSSFGQYQSLRYVSFPLQTLAKSTKIIPVMLMGKVLNKKSYPWIDYGEAVAISAGVSVFSFATPDEEKASTTTHVLGILMLLLYIVADSFTSQWQSRVYKAHPETDQFHMMFATNLWSIMLTLAALLISGELGTTIAFLQENPAAAIDNLAIAFTSATGQLFIFYTIKVFGPVVFTIIMTTRQMFSMVISTLVFGHTMGTIAYVGAIFVFGVLFFRIKRQHDKHSKSKEDKKKEGKQLAKDSPKDRLREAEGKPEVSSGQETTKAAT